MLKEEISEVPGSQKDVQISIIIATYNSELHIKECLESIIAQSFKNLES